MGRTGFRRRLATESPHALGVVGACARRRSWRCAGCSAAGLSPARDRAGAPTSRPSHPVVRRRDGRRDECRCPHRSRAVHDVSRQRGGARDPPVTCPTCRGSGQVAVDQGLFSMAQTCPQCRAPGGWNWRRRHAPPAVRHRGDPTQAQIQVKVRQHQGRHRDSLGRQGRVWRRGRPPRRLFMCVYGCAPDKRFGRKGNDLTVDVPVTFPKPAARARSSADRSTLEGARGRSKR